MRDKRAKQNGGESDPEVMVTGVRTRLQLKKRGKKGKGRKFGTRTFGNIVVRDCM